MPVSVSPRRHGVSRVLFGTDVAMPGSPAKPQSPRALAASQRSTYAPLPHKLSELKRVDRTSPSRGGSGIAEGEAGEDATSATAIVAARVVDRGLSPTSGRRRTAVGKCNVPSYVVAALAEGGTNAEVLYAPSSVTDTNRRQPPKFSTSTAPLTDREMGACTLPSSPLIVDLRTGSPVRGSISPRRPNMDAPSSHHHPSSSPRHSTTRQLNASLTHQHGSVRRNEADDTLPVIGSTAHCASFFPDSSYFRSSKRGTPPSQQQQQQPSSSPRALPTGSHLSSQDRHGVQAVLGSPGRLIGSIQPQCPPPTLPYSIPHVVPTRSGTNPIYPLEVTKGMVQADSQSAMYIPESGRMFRPTLVGYSEVEAAARDASIRRKWASGDKRAVAEAGLLLKKQQEATIKENNEHRRIEMKRYQKEYYEDRLQEYQRWEAKRIRLGHK